MRIQGKLISLASNSFCTAMKGNETTLSSTHAHVKAAILQCCGIANRTTLQKLEGLTRLCDQATFSVEKPCHNSCMLKQSECHYKCKGLEARTVLRAAAGP